VAKPLRLGLGACLIQQEYEYSDEEITLQIQEGTYRSIFADTGNMTTANRRSIHR
jgi:hypothetical protein